MISNFNKSALFVLAAGALTLAKPAFAIEYTELEVYGHQTASVGERELENLSTFSNQGGDSKGLFRSTFEFNYGLANNLEVAAYTDFQGTQSNDFTLHAVRVRGHYSFFEKNQLPVDLGIYTEFAFPRGEDSKMEGELRGVIEKDFDRLNISLNPIIERKLIVTNGASTNFAFAAATSVGYRIDQHWKPHLDLFGQLAGDEADAEAAGNELMVVPAVDYRVSRNFAMGARAGFGLTDATEKQLAGIRMEYEF
jgi:hypothetical protein